MEAPRGRGRFGAQHLPLGDLAYAVAVVWVVVCIALYLSQLIGIARG